MAVPWLRMRKACEVMLEFSSTAVLPKPIPIPAPVRASVHTQQAVKGCGTKDHPYDIDFTPAMRRGCGVSPETHCQQRDC